MSDGERMVLAIRAGRKRMGIMPSLDCTDTDYALDLVEAVASLPAVCGFKVGFGLGLACGLPEVVEALRSATDKPIVYDHQKAGTDIPDTGALFAAVMAASGVDAAILFPQAGPETLRAWVRELQEARVRPIVGGLMTHQGYLQSEGGWLSMDAVCAIYGTALELGVQEFVVPLTRPDEMRQVLSSVKFPDDALFYSPGFGAQKGAVEAAGGLLRHVVIVGRSFMQAPDPAAYVRQMAKELGGRK